MTRSFPAAILCLVAVQTAPPQAASADLAFQAARFRGLVMGSALRHTAWRILGKPTYSGLWDGNRESLEDDTKERDSSLFLIIE